MSRIVGNLVLWQKFALIGLISMCALVPPFWLVAKSHLGELGAAQSELSGVAPAVSVIELIRSTQAFRVAPADAARARVDKAYLQARSAVAGMQDSTLDSKLEAARRAWAGAAASGGAPLTALVVAQLALFEGITDNSGLILDPVASSYHVVAGSLIASRLSESLVQMQLRGASALAAAQIGADDKLALGALLALAGDQLNSTRNELEKSIVADPALGKALSAPLSEAVSQGQSALKLAEELVVSSKDGHAAGSGGAEGYTIAMSRAIDAQHALLGSTLKVLDDVLSDRVDQKHYELALVSAMVAAFAALTIGTIVLVTRATQRSVRAAADAARALASGDLTYTQQTTPRDEIGALLRTLRDATTTIAKVIGGIQRTSDSVSTAAVQIAQGNADLSERTEHQASNLQQTASSMEQLNVTVHNNAATAREAAQMAHAASVVATEGGQAVSRVVATMDEITGNSKKISDITNIIDMIAFQTNILALNAAVEAARAGEQGRGFAVVAAEVRSLASRSAEAAKEIKGLIQASVEKVRVGSSQVGEAVLTMDKIVSQVGRVTEMIEAISAATAQQTGGIGQVNDAVTQLDEMTQQNAALVQESAAAAASLQQQAEQLVGAVSAFRIDNGSRSAAVA